MKAAIIIGVMLMLSAAAQADDLYLEIGAGHNFSVLNQDRAWDNADDVGFYGSLTYTRPLSLNYTLVVHYVHVSQWFVGPPFGAAEAESSLDHIGVAIRFNLMRW